MQDTYALLSDVVQLAAAYQVPVTASALHVYYSAVVTMPSCRLQELASKYDLLPVLISERHSSWQWFLEGHSDRVTSVALSSDGKYIASGSADCTVRIWDTAAGIQLRIMTGNQKGINSVATFGDNKKLRVVSGSDDRSVRVWDVMTGALLLTMYHDMLVRSVAVSHDGKLIISGSEDCTIRVWDATTGILRLVSYGHNDTVYCVAFASDTKSIVSGSKDCTLRVWDAATGIQRLVINNHKNSVNFVAFSKDGNSVVSRAGCGVIRVWSADSGAPALTIDDPNDGIFPTLASRKPHRFRI
jgi:WD40 repeat protein